MDAQKPVFCSDQSSDLILDIDAQGKYSTFTVAGFRLEF